MNSRMSRWNRAKIAFELMRDSRVPFWIRAAVPAGVLLYVLSPVDLIPDFLLGVGQVDDLAIVLIGFGMLSSFLQRFAPADVVAEHLSRIFSTVTVSSRSSERAESDVIDAEFREYRG